MPTKISKPIPNENLSKAEKLFQGKIFGPESFDAYDGVLYFSAAGGSVYKFVNNDFVEVVRFGKTCREYKKFRAKFLNSNNFLFSLQSHVGY